MIIRNGSIVGGAAEEHTRQVMNAVQVTANQNKYSKLIRGKDQEGNVASVYVDAYDVLTAWEVQNPALQHLIKKALQPGERGHKNMVEDLKDIIASAKRALELEMAKGHQE